MIYKGLWEHCVSGDRVSSIFFHCGRWNKGFNYERLDSNIRPHQHMLRSPDTIPTEFPKLANHSVRFLPSCWLDGRFSRTPHLYNYKWTKKQGLLHNMDSFLAREEGKNDEQLATQAPAIALRVSWWGYWLGGSGTLDWHSSLGVSHLTIWLIWNQRGFSFSVLCWAKLLASAVVKLWGHQQLCKPQTITVQKETAKLKSPCGHIFLENLYLRAMASRNTVRHIRRPRFFHLPDIVDVLTKDLFCVYQKYCLTYIRIFQYF